jgi:hypothetical protein
MPHENIPSWERSVSCEVRFLLFQFFPVLVKVAHGKPFLLGVRAFVGRCGPCSKAGLRKTGVGTTGPT